MKITPWGSEDRQMLPRHHNVPLYVTVSSIILESKHTLIDIGSSLNIMLLSMLEEVGIELKSLNR